MGTVNDWPVWGRIRTSVCFSIQFTLKIALILFYGLIFQHFPQRRGEPG